MAEAPLGELSELIELRGAGFDEWQARAIVNTCERTLKPAPNRWTFWRIATLVVPAAAALVAVGAFGTGIALAAINVGLAAWLRGDLNSLKQDCTRLEDRLRNVEIVQARMNGLLKGLALARCKACVSHWQFRSGALPTSPRRRLPREATPVSRENGIGSPLR